MPSFKIIIPVFNPPPCVLETLEALRADGGIHANVILVDDGSTNGIGDVVGKKFPETEVIRGDGNLWWAGGMKAGMERAISEAAEVVVWLNHDCIPEKGTIMALVEEAAKAGTGAVTAWCKTSGYEGIMVNPGFRNFKEIPASLLQEAPVVVVDGVNGNCVAINAEAIKTIGLPDGLRHLHYGDGPYTWRLHRAGYINKVLTKQHALLVREFERCIDERSHSSVWPASLKNKLHYYFLSPRSKYHWKSRFYDLLVFRGKIIGTLLYPFVQAKLIVWVSIGHFQGKTKRQEDIIRIVTSKYSEKLPVSGLYEALVKLSQRKP